MVVLFLKKLLTAKVLNYFRKSASSWTFDWLLNTPLTTVYSYSDEKNELFQEALLLLIKTKYENENKTNVKSSIDKALV